VSRLVVRRRPVVEEFGPDMVALCPVEGGVPVVLVGTGVEIWHLIDGRRSVVDVAATLAGRYGAPVDAVSHDVEDLLGRLDEAGIVALSIVDPTVDRRAVSTADPGSRT